MRAQETRESDRAMRRAAIPFLCLGLVACGSSEMPCAELPIEARGKQPNIILLSIDTLNRSALRAFDDRAEEHPNLDHFAAGAARFVSAHSTASWTLPAHASLMTGLYPDRHGAVRRGRALSGSTPTVACHLKASGYETVGFTEGGHLDPRFGLASGFDRYDEWSAPDSGLKDWNPPRGGKAAALQGDRLFDRGIGYIRQRQPEDPPYFLFLHTYSVHNYFQLHPWTVERLPEFDDRLPEDYIRCVQGLVQCSDREWQRLEDLYAAGVHNVDVGFGRLLGQINSGDRNTFVLLLSDHGEGFDPERGRIHHGGRLHEDQLRIPLLVGGPAIVAQDVRMPVSLVDVMPTVMELAGLDLKGAAAAPRALSSSPTDGRSFAGALWSAEGERPALDGRVLYAFEHGFTWSEGRRFTAPETRERPFSRAVIRGEFWYLHSAKEVELYRMTDDPLQEANLLAGEAGTAAELRTFLDSRDFVPQGHDRAVDHELEQRLRSLGYLR